MYLKQHPPGSEGDTAGKSAMTAVSSLLSFYVLWSDWLLRRSNFSSKDQAVVIPGLGRLGNAARRLANGLAVASALHFDHVIVPEQAILERSIFREGHHVLSQATLWYGKISTIATPRVRRLGLADLLGPVPVGAGLDENSRDAIWPDLSSLLKEKPHADAFSESTIVIHLRGGDVFGKRKPPSYGQPPLGFYEKILRTGRWKSAVIVHQDHSNPVLTELMKLCDELAIVATSSSGALSEDLPVLMRARNLVVARGSFGSAVAGLSQHVRNVYFFEDKFHLDFKPQSVRLHRVVDTTGTFRSEVLSSNWVGSPRQYELMMTYGAENLAFDL